MDGQGFSREVAFSQSVINIGADQGNDIVLRGSSVADFHVLMHYDSGRWSISPLNGAYRTTVNGRSLDVEGTVLQNGSIVEIGTYRLTMMLNGVNTDIIIQSQSGADASMSSDSIGTDQNIQLEITKMDQTELEAGTAVEMELTVTNAGPLVANMQLQLQGIPSAWVQIIPPVLNLNEGRKGTFLVRISPPRNSSAQAGLYNMHFVAISPNYPQNTGIADTSLTILPYSEFLISGPAPMQLKLSRGKQTDIADVVVINSSNATGNYFIQSRDDSNELNFAYQKTGSGGLAAGQEMVTVRPGDSVQIPMEITAKKIPLLGVSSKHYHYYTNVTPSDRPGDAQTIAGEVVIKPTINTMVLLLLLALLIIAVGFIFQPYIHSFECQEGRRSQVIVAGNAAQLSWNVSGFASTITLNNGQTDSEVSNNGTQYVSPTVSTTYTLTAENFISNLLHITHKKTVQVLVVPSRPAIDVFSVDKGKALYDETVTLNWSVEPNATAASITSNKATTQLAAENYTGKLAQGYQTDTLISLKAQNDSGYDLKSLFINVASDNISLVKFTVWVRPNGIAIPEDNDVRRTTRWGSLQLTGGTELPVRSGASGVNPQPAAQSNTLEIPDNYNSTGAGTQLLNPEVMAAAGQQMPSSGTYSYQPPAAGSGGAPAELLVSPSLNPTPAPTAAVPAASAADSAADSVIIRPAAVPTGSVPSVSAVSDSVVVRSTAAPAASPEGASPNRDFTIKLAEVIEDPLEDSGYRVISYYPNYVLQKQEQILVEWNVDGVSKVKIENLSGDDLQNVGGDYAYPEKSTTYTLTAQVGETKKAYSLPVNVAGDPDDGEGSGLKCDLKANAATLKVPGSVMLTWTGGGNNRVQLISSTQAEKENDEAEKKKEEEAKAKGEKYEKPKDQPLTGGTIGDYLQPSGFMRVNVDKQTTFVLNAYDASNNVICTKSVEVKYEGGNDKKDIKLKITKIADENGVSQPVYGKGQMVSYTVALTDFVKGTDPTGAIAITDGTSTCSVNWPVNTCSFQAKKTGELTITAVYAGDDVYKKATATAKETVVDKMPTSTQINSAIKPAGDKADVEVELMWDHKSSWGLVPTGTVTLTAGSTSCDVNMETETMTCAGEVDVVKVAKDKDAKTKEQTAGSIYISIKNMGLKDATPDRVTAAYKGDSYFMPSTSQSVLFLKVPTTLKIDSAIKYNETFADIVTLLDWDKEKTGGRTPTGTIKFTVKDGSEAPSAGDATTGTCTLDIVKKTMNCEPGKADIITDKQEITATIKKMLLADKTADRVKAEYSGDFIFNASESTTVTFNHITTETSISNAVKTADGKANLVVSLSWIDAAEGKNPTGTITLTAGSGTCELNVDSGKLSGCKGTVTKNGYEFVIEGMTLSDPAAASLQAKYNGDSQFLESESQKISFDKVDTEITVEYLVKTSDVLANLAASLIWDLNSTSSKPTGTVTFIPANSAQEMGSCVYDITAKTYSCKGTKGEDVDPEGDYIFKITDLPLGDASVDRVTVKYSGDNKFNPSTSTMTVFAKIPTTLGLTEVSKPGALFANATADLIWDDDASGSKRPTGTITFTIGTGGETCVYTMGSGDFTCEEEGQTVITTYEDTDGVFTGKFVRMLLKTTGADRIKAAYSGDSYFEKSETNYYGFEKIDPNLTITKVTDDEGKEHQWYKPEQKGVRVYIDMPGAVAGTDPTGPVTIQIDSETCTITYPQDFCSLNLTKVKGDLTVTATYGGDDIYLSGKAEYSPLKVQDPQPLKLEITRIADHEDQKQDEYSKSDEIKVTVKLSGYATEELPTGDITVKLGPSDSNSCKIAMPTDTMPTGTCQLTSPDADGNYQLTAEYAGNSWYDKASAEPEQVKISNYAIDFEIVSITNNRTDTTTGKYITQPYYVFDPDKDPAPGEGQEVRICVKFSNYEHGAPDKDKYISVGDFDHEDTHDLASFKVGTENESCGTFKVKKYTSTITLTAKFPGDGNYVSRTATKTMDVQNRTYPELNVLPAVRNYGEANQTGTLIFSLDHDSELPEEVKPESDTTYGPAKDTKIKFEFSASTSYNCFFNLATRLLEGDCAPDSQSPAKPDQYGIYTIQNVKFPVKPTGEDKITGKYEGNTYFYPDEDTNNIYIADGRYTHIDLKDALRYKSSNNTTKGHAFFIAEMSYAETVTGSVPTGYLSVSLPGPTITQCNIDDFSSCGEKIERDGRLIFTFYDWVVSSSAIPGSVTVTYGGDGTFNPSETASLEFTVEGPVGVKITEAKKITVDRAEIEFSHDAFGSLTDKYKIFTKIRLSSKGTDTEEKTCTVDINTLDFISGDCMGVVTKNGNTFKITNFRGIIDKEDDTFSVAFLTDYPNFTEEEYPKASKEFEVEPIKTTLTISDLLKYNYTHGFATVTLAYDEDKAIAMDQYPGGRLHFVSNTSEGDSASPRFCYYDLKTHELTPECPEGLSVAQVIDAEYGTNQYKILNLTVQERHTVLDVTYEMDDYYTESADSKTYTEELPSVTIRNTMKSDANEAYAAFTVNMGSLSEKYDLLQGFRFSSLSSGKVCQWSLSDGRFEPEEGEGGQSTPSNCSMDSLTNDGNLYVLKKLSGDFSTGDTKFSIGLANEYMAAADYPKAEADYSKIATTSIVNRVGAYELPDKRHTFLTYTLTYDKTYPEIYGLLPMGSVEMKKDSDGHDPTCTYYPATDSFDGCVGEVKTSEPGTLILQFKNILTAYGDTYWGSGKYSGDSFLFESVHSNNSVSVRSDMGVSIKNLTRSSNFQMVSASFRINYLPSIIEYGIFESAYIYAASSNELGMNSPDGSYSSVIINLQTLEANLRGGTVTKSSDGYTLNVDQWGKNYTYGYFKSYPYFWVILKNSPYFGEDFILYDVKPFAATSSTFSATSASPVSMSIALGGQ